MKDEITHITIVHIIVCPSGGGAEFLVRELGKRILSKHFKSIVVYFNNKPQNGNPINDIRNNEFLLNIGNRNPLAIFKIRKLIKKQLQTNKNLILHTHLTWPLYFTVIASMFLNVKLIHTEHNTSNKRRHFIILKLFERLIYSRYSKIICISNGVSRSLCEWLGNSFRNKIVTVNNGAKIFTYHARHSMAKRKPKMISVGSLTRKKGFENSIKAIPFIKDSIEEYTIIGEGNDRIRLCNLVKQLKIEDKVNFLGWQKDVEKHLDRADIQLIPSLWEGFGLVAVEGMSTGLAIIASNVDGLREVLNENNPAAILINDYEKPEEWATAIKKMIKKIKRNHILISGSARKFAENYSIDKMIEKYKAIYRVEFINNINI